MTAQSVLLWTHGEAYLGLLWKWEIIEQSNDGIVIMISVFHPYSLIMIKDFQGPFSALSFISKHEIIHFWLISSAIFNVKDS